MVKAKKKCPKKNGRYKRAKAVFPQRRYKEAISGIPEISEVRDATLMEVAARHLRDEIIRLNNLRLGERVAQLETLVRSIAPEMRRISNALDKPSILNRARQWLRAAIG